MTLQTIILLIAASAALMSVTGAAYAIVRWRSRENLPPEPDHQEGMYHAHKLWCDALDEAALSGDVKEYDRIEKMGWRRFSQTMVDAA